MRNNLERIERAASKAEITEVQRDAQPVPLLEARTKRRPVGLTQREKEPNLKVGERKRKRRLPR
jgi:hypothetical protein